LSFHYHPSPIPGQSARDYQKVMVFFTHPEKNVGAKTIPPGKLKDM